MDDAVLNPNQRRRVATHLRLLSEDLAEVAAWPEMARPGEPYVGIRDSVAGLLAVVREMREALNLPADRTAPLRRRVMAVAEMWATSVEDLKAENLRGYGRVHPDLSRVLDRRADEIVRRLRRLTQQADALPER